MSQAYDDGCKAGEKSYGQRRMSDLDALGLDHEFMAGYCMVRADDLSAGDQSFYYLLGEHAGYYGLPKALIKSKYDSSADYSNHFEAGYKDGHSERYGSDDNQHL
ncbi:MAG: hypothetical protein RSE65_21705 [Hafnia sp.]